MMGTIIVAQSIASAAKAAPESFADLVEEVSPAVVNITTMTMIEVGEVGNGPLVPEGSPFEDFFREFEDRNPGNEGRSRRSTALGSGFVISVDGYVVTNNHVIEDADEIMIEFFSGEELPATLIGRDPKTDIAVLKVDADDELFFVEFGDSDVARVGDWVMAMGNPLGQGFSVSAGIISARNRSLSGTYDDFIQTDAAINRGNSGGPLFNMDGEVIGVNTAILSPNGGSIGIGFSMASKVVSGVVDQLEEFGETRRGWLGVRIQDVSSDMAEALGLDATNGAMVTDVPDGPAADAGIASGDIIVSFDGSTVEDVRDLVNQVGAADVGAIVEVDVIRDGELVTIDVTLGRRELAENTTETEEPEVNDEPQSAEILGITLFEITDTLIEETGIPEGTRGLFVAGVDETSEAFEKGLRAGAIIEKAGRLSVNTLSELQKQVDATIDTGRTSVLLLVRSNGNPRFLALSVGE
ncbi:MAG: Do family serine endopeptidase [Paracoccaceae bacterium]|nr:Do family serine endopeptidase [Paracoccaceae bacterium]